MTQPIMLSVALPFFPGFYESDLSAAIDREEEMWVEYRCDGGSTGPDYESDYPAELALEPHNLGELLYEHTDYQVAHLSLARQWLDGFDYEAGQALGMTTPDKRQRWTGEGFADESYDRPSIGLRFEEMTSPREYNFTTDRLFGLVPLKVMRELFKRSAAERHVTLHKVIRERFTSRSGFISFYPTDLRTWIKKPLREWDSNELGTLLWAALRMAGADVESAGYYEGFAAEVRETGIGHEGASHAFESAVNWTAFDRDRAQRRSEKLAAWEASEPEAAKAWVDANPEHVAEMRKALAAEVVA